MVGFLIMIILLSLGLYLSISLSDVKEIKENWSKNRCRASVMPFASVYGFDTQENFRYCMSNIMTAEAGPLLGPVFQILGTIIGSVAIIINTMNSFRIQIATMMGGINTVFQNFTDRMVQLSAKLKMSAARIKSLMLRLYGIFFSIIYMSVSGVRAMNNFSNTFLFSFLDTFCFDPDTPVEIQGRGSIPIRDVRIGDRFQKDGSQVTSTFQFDADGQPMAKIGPVIVSTNHFIQYEGKKIRVDEHPDALVALPWGGGSERPLICLNTDTHHIPIGNYTFMDYDESDDADDVSMKMIQSIVNAGLPSTGTTLSYSNCISPQATIKTKKGETPIESIRLGDEIATGKVIGKVQKEVTEICKLPDGTEVGAGTLIWDSKQTQWKRAGDLFPVKTVSPQPFWNLITTPSAVIETSSGICFRDYMELHSHDAEKHYESCLRAS